MYICDMYMYRDRGANLFIHTNIHIQTNMHTNTLINTVQWWETETR